MLGHRRLSIDPFLLLIDQYRGISIQTTVDVDCVIRADVDVETQQTTLSAPAPNPAEPAKIHEEGTRMHDERKPQ